MCDFREITKIEVEGKILDVKAKNIYLADMPKITQEGLYHICASGSFNLYFDGQTWYSEKTDAGSAIQKQYPPLWSCVLE